MYRKEEHKDDYRHKSRDQHNFEDKFYRDDRFRYMESPHPKYRRRPSTPPSELKKNLRFDPRDMCKIITLSLDLDRNDDKRLRKSSKMETRTYLHLAYYDLAFMLHSDHLAIEKEVVALDAVYRYGMKVIDEPGVINRLIRGVRFGYLELNDILSIASNDKKLFSNCTEFQNRLSKEIERRLKLSMNIPVISTIQPLRVRYKSKAMVNGQNVAQ